MVSHDNSELEHYFKFRYEHLKMDSIITIIKIVTKDFHGKIDLKDAYYSALLSKKLWGFLISSWDNRLYCFTCFPNDLRSCPRKFTKLNKVSITTWHFENLNDYIDEIFTKGKTLGVCQDNIHKTILLNDWLDCNALVVKALDPQSRGTVFKTTGWLQGRLSLSSFQGR